MKMSGILHLSPERREEADTSRYRMASTRMLIRGGYIQIIGDGLFAYLPMGMMVMKKLGHIIAEEFRAMGGEEILLPFTNPGELWRRSDRQRMISRELTTLKDKHGETLVLAPMHEEAAMEMLARSISHVDQLPRFFFQFQGKFRDEVLDESGILKAREFMMSDGYSFHRSFAELNNFMPRIFALYSRVFRQLGLRINTTEGSANFTGGTSSYDFLMPHEQGEDVLVRCPSCGYNANQDVAVATSSHESRRPLPMETITNAECFGLICFRRQKGLPKRRTACCSMFQLMDGIAVAVYRSDKTVSADKLARVIGEPVIAELSEKELADLGYTRYKRPRKGRRSPGPPTAQAFLSPVGMRRPLTMEDQGGKFITVVDSSVSESSNLIFSQGTPGKFLINVNFGRDFDADFVGDFVAVDANCRCHHCGSALNLEKHVKIASVYRIGEYFSRKFDFTLVDQRGDDFFPSMGAYGIGLWRLLAGLVEAHRLKTGFIWPMNIAPYQAAMVIVGRGATILEIGSKLHQRLGKHILMDDRKLPLTAKFRDLDETGIPIRIIVSGQTLDDGKVMIWHRRLCPPTRIQLNHVEGKIRELEDLEQERFEAGSLFPPVPEDAEV
jgi:prolyl-tRNA synthetase